MVAQLHSILQKCRDEITNDPNHELSFYLRNRLLSVINTVVPGLHSGSLKISNSHFIRAKLALSCAKKVLYVWENNIEEPHAQRMIQLSELYLQGQFDYDALSKDMSAFYGGLLNAETQKEMTAFPAGRAAATAAGTVLDDEIAVAPNVSNDEIDDPQDPDYFDCAYWAAAAFSGDYVGESNFEVKRSEEFWQWYVKTAESEILSSV